MKYQVIVGGKIGQVIDTDNENEALNVFLDSIDVLTVMEEDETIWIFEDISLIEDGEVMEPRGKQLRKI
tara:strand:+ start:54 stop:260 length:207 start_codon:yes stop_codon:yes gene_type:complete